ncbi:MAG: tRNA (adenosine(37)-N6)-threonylcarbamoyltransferase complex dimerization subunit type 1 TsaB [Asticcacaulis sp.]
MAACLVIDTSLNACSLGLFDADACLFQISEPMTRGQQERLPVMAAEAFAATGLKPQNLGLMAVTLGPGSFTGVRVGLSFAKGLAVGANVPLKGIGTLEALGHHEDVLAQSRLAAIQGGRGQIYVQAFPDGAARTFDMAEPDALTAFAQVTPLAFLTGPTADSLSPFWPQARILPQTWPSLAAIYTLAEKGGHDDMTPLYMREADAIASTRGIITLNAAP